jgi:hypothetical protein
VLHPRTRPASSASAVAAMAEVARMCGLMGREGSTLRMVRLGAVTARVGQG